MIDAIRTFWTEFLGSEYSQLMTCLVVLVLVFVVYGFLLRPFFSLCLGKSCPFLRLIDIAFVVVLLLFCLFQFSPDFLSFSSDVVPDVSSELPVESELSIIEGVVS